MCSIHVDSLIRPIGNGCTEPVLSSIKINDEDILAVIKMKGNEQGILPLVNEYFCYLLTTELKILMPESGIGIIDGNTKCSGEIQSSFGSCFYSTYIKNSNKLNAGIVDLISNKEMFEEIILFDHIVYNKDRNAGNLLISANKNNKILYVIDHTHVFKNQTLWDAICFKQGIRGNDYKDTEIISSNKYIYDMLLKNRRVGTKRLQEISDKYKSIKKEQLEEIAQKIPRDWTMKEEDIYALIDYLLYRINNIDSICEVISDYEKWGMITCIK